MTVSERPFAPPNELGRDLARVLTFWEGLKRGDAEMPFWDDVNMSALPVSYTHLTLPTKA